MVEVDGGGCGGGGVYKGIEGERGEGCECITIDGARTGVIIAVMDVHVRIALYSSAWWM